jgi:hypothetical protein
MKIKGLLKFMLLFCCVLLLSQKSNAQSFKLIKQIDTIAKIASVDNLGNLFLVTPANEVMKFNPDGKFLWNYTNNSFGDIDQIDITDPLRVILYYQAYQQVVVLNNNLSEISSYSFNNNPNQQIALVASANNNGFWIYDQLNRELKKLSNNFIDELKSGNIFQRNGFDMNAVFMLSNDQYVFINDTGEGVRIFDRFGNYYKTAVINPTKAFEVEGEELIYQERDKLYRYNFMTFKKEEIKLPISKPGNTFGYRLKRLFILNEKGLTLWALNAN